MKRFFLCFFTIFCSLITNSQIFFIDKTSNNFSINEKMLSAREKFCYTINCISISDSLFKNSGGLTPLIFIKIFNKSLIKKELNQKPINCLDLREYVQKTVMPALKADMVLNVADMSPVSNKTTVNVYDSLLIFDGKKYSLLDGVVEVSFYNLFDFEQVHIQQSSLTIINTKAKIAPTTKNEKDGLQYVSIEKTQQQGIFEKLYLTGKKGDLFSFNLLSIDKNEDDELDYHREFVYKKDYGIIEFKGKWLFFHERDGIKGASQTLYSSKEYFEFK